MRIFTVEPGRRVMHCALVKSFAVTPDTVVPAITVGESGRGRRLGVLPVRLSNDSYKLWKENGKVEVEHVELSSTRSGRPALVETSGSEADDEVVLVILGWIGFRGSNALEVIDPDLKLDACIAVSGTIAQGDAGRMGSGGQWVVKVPVDTRLRFRVGGRLYGAPSRYIIDVATKSHVICVSEDAYELL